MNAPPIFDAMKNQFSVSDGNRAIPAVATAQVWLNHRNRQRITVDGYYGSVTEGAVKSLQQAHGATVDGVLGPQTWSVLLNGRLVVAMNRDVMYDAQNDRVMLHVTIQGKTAAKIPFLYDTGSFEAYIIEDWAQKAGLPHLKETTVGGIGGAVKAHTTVFGAKFGDGHFKTVHGVIVPSGFQNLWGLRFATARGLSIDINKDTPYIAYYR